MTRKGKIFISGGGDEKQSFKLDEIYIHELNPLSIIYIPIAMKRDQIGYEACYDWFIKALSQHTKDYINISMVLDLKTVDYSKLITTGSIYLGGGNTYKLLDEVLSSGFHILMKEYFVKGGIIYGGSAGAIILGKDISTAIEEKDRDIDSKGLNLLNGYSVCCHIKEAEIEKMRKFCLKTDQKVLALPEGSGLVFSGGQFKVVGRNTYIISRADVEEKIVNQEFN